MLALYRFYQFDGRFFYKYFCQDFYHQGFCQICFLHLLMWLWDFFSFIFFRWYRLICVAPSLNSWPSRLNDLVLMYDPPNDLFGESLRRGWKQSKRINLQFICVLIHQNEHNCISKMSSNNIYLIALITLYSLSTFVKHK